VERRDSLAAARGFMVERQLRVRGIRDGRVLAAMGEVPRELFVPRSEVPAAYDDCPLSIGHGQTISQPYIVALMTELIEPVPGMRVLEIGTGSGYQAAILAECDVEVYSVEVVPQLHRWAGVNLENAGYAEAVHLKLGNGYLGWPEEAPFDAAVLTCSPRRLPTAIGGQVAPGGKIVAPIGGYPFQDLVLFEVTDGGLSKRRITSVLFVPMVDVEPDKGR
jgi:protein-L-isoaspartate(D-aspartate) O-methyltransferase